MSVSIGCGCSRFEICFFAMWNSLRIFLFGLAAVVYSQVADPVKVTVYYESLCPDSIMFFTTQLEPTYNELSEIMIVETHAYGKATDDPNGAGYNFTCQHGPDECYGNKVLACGQTWIASHNTLLNFDFCVMGAPYPPSAGADCAAQVGIPYLPIGNCANTTEGEILLHNVGLLQAQLDPTLYYVPWILINDEFTQANLAAAQSNLKQLVCNTYLGTPPAACLISPTVSQTKIEDGEVYHYYDYY